MNKVIKGRIIKEAKYIIKNNSTIRDTSRHFNVSKSTVHNDISKKLFYLDKTLFFEVNNIIIEHIQYRHIKGGEATKQKFKKI